MKEALAKIEEKVCELADAIELDPPDCPTIFTEDISCLGLDFECLTDPNFSSPNWQSSTFYNATGLSEGTTYTFRVRARDDLNNTTYWSMNAQLQQQSA